MYDIVPPNPSAGRPRRAKRPRAQRRFIQPRRLSLPSKPAGSTTIKLDWQLPARLRRPVRQELEKERRKQQQRRAIVQFERRPIHTELPTAYPKYTGTGMQAPPADLAGAEQHTGDIYRHSRPGVQLPPPPYRTAPQMAVGRVLVQPARPQIVKKSAVITRKISLSVTPARQMKPAQRSSASPAVKLPAGKSSFPLPAAGIRDVPYSWGKVAQAQPFTAALPNGAAVQLLPRNPATLTNKRRRFALPLHFSVFPLSWLPGRNKTSAEGLSRTAQAVKKKISGTSLGSAALLLAGCGVAIASVWLLQGAGRGYLVVGSLQNRATQAYGHIVAAQSALASTDFKTSEQEFAQAQVLLQEARQELSDALASSKVILEYVDVTGTVRSSDQLLVAGEHLTAAGQRVAHGIGPLLEVNVFAGDSTSDSTMVDALEAAFVDFRAADEELQQAEQALDNVASPLLPLELQSQLATLNESIPKARQALRGFLELNDVIMHVLGAQSDRQYLLLFENNHEQRPTGGFIGSVGLVNIARGVVEKIDVQSVYDPDGQLKERIAPPAPLQAVNNRWFMRDANWFVDFSVSAQKIADFFEKEGGSTVDGIIAMTPEVIKELLEVTGPIEVPSFSTTVSAENFVVLTQDQVTYSYDREQNRPKQFLADLTPLLLNRVFAARAEDTLKVLGSLGDALVQKQLLIYFRDSALQEKVEAIGWGGTLPQNAQGFLSVNNANIGGHKSDQFIEQEIDYRTELRENGDAEVVVTVRRTHRGPQEVIDFPYPAGENPAYKDNIVWQRVLVPAVAELVEARGFSSAAEVPRVVATEEDALPLTADADVAEWQRTQHQHNSGTLIGEEAGYRYFANWLITKPGDTTVGLYRYRIPAHAVMPGLIDQAGQYRIHVLKQPGDTRTALRVELRLPENLKLVHTVPTDGVTQTGQQAAVYRGALRKDALIGAVFEKQ